MSQSVVRSAHPTPVRFHVLAKKLEVLERSEEWNYRELQAKFALEYGTCRFSLWKIFSCVLPCDWSHITSYVKPEYEQSRVFLTLERMTESMGENPLEVSSPQHKISFLYSLSEVEANLGLSEKIKVTRSLLEDALLQKKFNLAFQILQHSYQEEDKNAFTIELLIRLIESDKLEVYKLDLLDRILILLTPNIVKECDLMVGHLLDAIVKHNYHMRYSCFELSFFNKINFSNFYTPLQDYVFNEKKNFVRKAKSPNAYQTLQDKITKLTKEVAGRKDKINKNNLHLRVFSPTYREEYSQLNISNTELDRLIRIESYLEINKYLENAY